MIRYIDEFRNKKAAQKLIEEIIASMPRQNLAFMEICGGHTLTAMKYGLHGLLPKNLSLKSGPGCPVCVTSREYIDTAIHFSRRPDMIVTSFGDMLRVPGTETSLLKEKALGRDVRICLSPLEAVGLAEANPDRQVVFLGIGFETTAPTVASAISLAQEKGLRNFSVLAALKTMPAAMDALLAGGEIALDGFVCPGHVTAITGTALYEPVVQKYGKPCVISGFEPTDMLQSILMLVRLAKDKRAEIRNQYSRIVRPEGNPHALAVLDAVFSVCDACWRGLGTIPDSGLAIKAAYAEFDAARRFPIPQTASRENPRCICGDVMRGVKSPRDCRLFRKGCNPENPVGACMVSAEGACGIFYRYS